MTTFEVVHTLENGRRIVIVPMSNSSRKVKLLETDCKELDKLGVGLPWKWSLEQVWVRNAGRLIAVARLILDADKGEQVRYLDKDPTNLVRNNLIRVAGSSKYKARERLRPAFKWNTPDIIHTRVPTREGWQYMPRKWS
jgi:hypothetical protein